MIHKLIPFAVLIAALGSVAAEARTDLELIRDVVESQKERIYAKYGRGMEVDIQPSMQVNAFASFARDDANQPQVTFFEGVLKAMDQDALVIVVCHELGHHLGHLTLADIGQAKTDRLSVEGEADYFAGQCADEFFREEGDSEPTDRVVAAARDAFSTLEKERLPPAVETGPGYPGVDGDYPDTVCRMVTVENGARGLQRPACWYNPSADRGSFEMQ